MLVGTAPLVLPHRVNDVNVEPYKRMASPVLIDRWPLCSRAFTAVGHVPSPRPCMCARCGEPLSSPIVSSVTVAVSPRSRTVAVPLPVTWFVGTAANLAADAWTGGAGVGEGLPDVAMTTTPIRAPVRQARTNSPSSGQRYRRRNTHQPKPARTSLARVSRLRCSGTGLGCSGIACPVETRVNDYRPP